jgi:AraC family transcriptional regulator
MSDSRGSVTARNQFAVIESSASIEAPDGTLYVVRSRSRAKKRVGGRPVSTRERRQEGRSTATDESKPVGCTMHRSISSHHNPSVAAIAASPPDPLPTVQFSPAAIVRHRTAHWRGVLAKTVQIISHEHFEYRFKQQCHLLIAVEQGVRYDGETFIEGLPKSTLRNYSHKLIFVPAGRMFFGVQNPRLLTRSICLYIDPQKVLADPDLRFAEADLQPRLLFEDGGLWEIALKLKSQIGSADPGDRMYADALGGLLAHELLRLDGATARSRRTHRGGLAGWQQARVIDFMEEHLAEDISLRTLADLARLSPYHFLRCFKESFGEPPHRYWAVRRIERAKALLANPGASITEIALDVGFSTTSALSAAFRRMTGQTPTEYRRSLE